MKIFRRDLIQKTVASALGFGLSDFVKSEVLLDPTSKQFHWQEEVDVIVVGSGGAGLSAAITAAEEGVGKVLVLEKEPVVGGNTLFSGGYFNAVDPERQNPQGIKDSVEKHFQQTMAGGRYRGKEELVRTLCGNALPTLHWLERFGIRWEPQCLLLHGSMFPRGHVPTTETLNEGCPRLLLKHCQKLGVEVRTQTAVIKLVRNQKDGNYYGQVNGVIAVNPDRTEVAIRARKGVVLAAGGYAANRKMCAAHDPRLKGLPTTNASGATGEIMLAASEIGAFLSGCDFIECLPLDPKYSRLSLFIERCIFVDRTGRRFIREDASRDDFRDGMLTLPKKEAYVILDNNGFLSHPEIFRKDAIEGIKYGEVFTGDSLQSLARQMRIPVSNLQETVAKFNEFVGDGIDRDFGRSSDSLVYLIEKPPFWASKAHLSLHYTPGGVEIDECARVLDWNGEPIPRLFAAGEITTGIHGECRLGGNSITEIYVFGRIAGHHVAQEQSS